MSYNIGINVVEVDGKATPSIQPAPTSVAAFIIRSQRGYIVPTPKGDTCPVQRVTNWSQFTEHFGSYLDDAYGAYSVRGFFDNGGATAYITRVVETGAGGATAAWILSNENSPWNLEPGAQIVLKRDGDFGEAAAMFLWEPAALKGGTSFVLFDADGNGSYISFKINAVLSDEYRFDSGDFPSYSDEDPESPVPANEVAAVMNRRFSGIRAYVADDGSLRVRTDRGDGDATLEAIGGEDPDKVYAAEILFGGNLTDQGAGNVKYIDAVTPQEAAAVISHAVNAAIMELLVSCEGKRIRIEHPETGSTHFIQVVDKGEDTPGILGFDYSEHPGEDASDSDVATTAQRTFSGESGPALTVKAGYRGHEDPGAWGMDIAIRIIPAPDDAPQEEEKGIYALSVQHNGNIVETWGKLNNSDAPDANGQHPQDVINNEFTGSRYIKVIEESTTNPRATADLPDAQDGFVKLEDGNDDSLGKVVNEATLAGLAADALARFDTVNVQLVCCPESCHNVWVHEALGYCANRGDCIFVGHTPESRHAEGAESWVKEEENQFQGDKVYGVLYFPWIRVRDPLDGQKWIPPTGHILGVYARTERERGIWKAPAGNAARLNGALDTKYHITDKQHTILVKQGSINAVRAISGLGIVIDSSRSLSTSNLWLYVNIRLLFNFVKSSLKDGLRWVVQEPNDDTLWNKVKYNSVTPFLMGLWRRGAFGPGGPEDVFTVKCDAETNPPANIQQGVFTVEVYFYPSRPAETIIIIVGQQEGGGSASEA